MNPPVIYGGLHALGADYFWLINLTAPGGLSVWQDIRALDKLVEGQ